MINPIHLKTFLTLSDTLHFTRTAEALNVTQPGVSQHLKALETELNVSLFHRYGKKIELTPAGELFRQFSQECVNSENRLRDRLKEDSPYKGECKITCSGSMATLLYPKLLELQKQFKELCISLEASPNEASIELVKRNEFDMGLITCFLDDPEIQITELGYEELCLVLPKNHSAEWSDLMALGYIFHPNGAHYATQVFEQNYAREFTGIKDIPKKGYINQLNQILLPVAQGLGFTVLPESTVDLFPEPDLITKVPLKMPCRETIYLAVKKYKPLPNRFKLIKGCLSEIWLSSQKRGIC